MRSFSKRALNVTGLKVSKLAIVPTMICVVKAMSVLVRQMGKQAQDDLHA